MKLGSFIKKSRLWKSISNTSLYYRLTDPAGFAEYIKELRFYRALLRSYPGPNDLIFDVGANMGRKSYFFSKIARTVIAFEPGERLYRFLIKRFAESNVKVLNYALGSRETEADFYLVMNNQAYNSLSKKHIETKTRKDISDAQINIKTTRVRIITLQYFIKQFGTPKYLKIDVEGYEKEVIKGLKTRVPIISFEANIPEFLEETLEIIGYLDDLSSGNYLYNFSTGSFFLLNNYISPGEAKDYLRKFSGFYVEVYARLENNPE